MRKIPRIASEYLRRYRRHKVWQRLVAAVASVVVFCTTYALILPAITMSADELEQHGDEYGIKTGQTAAEAAALGVVHVHGDACYETRQVLDCPFEVHQHTAACYEDGDEEGEPICGYADFVVHTHDRLYCYDADGTLVCTLTDEYPAAHTHDASCYAEAAELHTPNTEEAAVTTTPANTESKAEEEAKEADDDSEKAPDSDTPADSADSPDSDKQDADDEKDLNQDSDKDPSQEPEEDTAPGEDEAVTPAVISDSTGDSTGDSADGLADAAEPEVPSESGLNLTALAYEVAEPVVLENDVDDTENGLIEEGAEEEATPEPLCGKKEAVLHTHTDEPDSDGNSCWNTADELVCGKIEVRAHQHDESCLREEQVLVCDYATAAGEESAAAVSEDDSDSAEEASAAGAGPRRAGAKRASEDEEAACEHEWKNGVCTVCETACTHAEFEEDTCTACGLTKEEIEAAAAETEAGASIVCEEHLYGDDGVCTVCGLQDHELKTTLSKEEDDFGAQITVRGALPVAAVVQAEVVDGDDYNAQIHAAVNDMTWPSQTYDIKILAQEGGIAWQPSEALDVTLKLQGSKADIFRGYAPRVLHIDTSDGTTTAQLIDNVTVTETTETDASTGEETTYTSIAFKAERFSPYVLAVDMNETDDDDGGDDGGNGDEGSMYANAKKLSEALKALKLDDNGNGTLGAGEYILDKNITLGTYDGSGTSRGSYPKTILISSDVTIDLNGHVLKGSSADRIIMQSDGILIIQDSDTSTTHYGTVNSSTYLWTYTGDTPANGKNDADYVTVDNFTTDLQYVKIKGGVITGGGVKGSNPSGAIESNGGSLWIEGGTIAGNQAAWAGGGIRCQRSNNDNQTATGADYTFKMTGGAVCYNVSDPNAEGKTGNGGGMYLSGICVIEKGTIAYNYASGYGGGMRITSQMNTKFTMSDGVIKGNKAGEEGGGVEISMGHAGATQTGANSPVVVNFTGGTLENNQAGTDGGAFSMSENPNKAIVTVTLNVGGEAIIKNNSAGGNGGGISLGYGTFNLGEKGGGTFKDNTAGGNGGGVYVKAGSANISGGTVSSNRATKDGGGVYVTKADSATDVQVNITGGTIGGNAETDGNTAENGGGVYVDNGDVAMSSGVIKNNTASVNGGGIAIVGTSTNPVKVTAKASDTDADGIEVSCNTATTGNGGGIYIEYGSFDMDAATITDNKAENWNVLNQLANGNGGGVYVKDGEVTLDGGTVQGNTCSRFGGGVYIWAPKYTSQLTGGEVKDNKAGQCGGGVAIYQSNATFTNTNGSGVHIESNTAVNGGGLYLRWGSKLTMNGGYVKNNTAVALDSTSDKFFSQIQSSTSTGTDLSKTSIVQHADGDTGGNGGGVFIHNSTLTLNAATGSGDIAENTAARHGGGVYALHSEDSNSADGTSNTNKDPLQLDLTDGNIENNTAGQFGGGIAMFAATSCEGEGASATEQNAHMHANATIAGDVHVNTNTAVNGGGFYVGGGKLEVTGGIVKGNQAKGTPVGVTTAYKPDANKGVGGGLYVYDTGTLLLDIQADANDSTKLGVYSNLADFAADDVYCGPLATSDINLPKAANMNLTDYMGNIIGYAINWFEDYPLGDSAYDSRATVDKPEGLTTSQTTASTYSPVRYRKATAEQKRAFNITSANKTVTGYLCLTLGYYYKRVNLTIKKELPGTDSNSGQTFAFEATITRPTKTNGNAVLATDEALIFAWGTTNSSGQGEKYTFTADGTDKTIVTFTLKAGQSVTLEGIPAYASVTIEEKATDAQKGTATSGPLYTPLYTWDGNGKTGNDERTLTQDGMTCTLSSVGNETYYTVTCTNLANGAQLPQTGGSGTRRYTRCGLALLALAAGGALGGKRRRKRRAGKGAGA